MLSWIAASTAFLGLTTLYGGPSTADMGESVFSTWSLAHGDLTCFYPPRAPALTAPLYPLLSGAGAWLLRIGHAVPFPSVSQLGANCARAVSRLNQWSLTANATLPTLRLAYIVWPFLLAGLILVIRASGRGRTGWEPLLLFAVTATPCVIMCITDDFHPEDLLSMGLLLMGVAAFLKKKWTWAGVLLALAACAQQFALLVALPLIAIAPSRARMRLAITALLVSAFIDVPLMVANSGRAVRAILLGSSLAGNYVRSLGGTVLWETNLRGPLLFVISRVLPIVGVTVLAWWSSRRLGTRLLQPSPLMSLLATTLTVRLIFEENLFGYYFMAVAVSLIVLDVITGRFRGSTLVWIAIDALAFIPFTLGYRELGIGGQILFVLATLALSSLLAYVATRRFKWYKTAWCAFAAVVCEYRIWGIGHHVHTIPTWWWQVVLVPTALSLAVSALASLIRNPQNPIPVDALQESFTLRQH